MDFRLEQNREIKLCGLRVEMSFTNDKTFNLWNRFMTLKNSIHGVRHSDMYSVQIYPQGFFESFNPQRNFEKWAAIPVISIEKIPDVFETLIIRPGLYAVFNYKGKASEAGPFYQSIHTDWLPASGYFTDARPHFEILGEKYRHEDINSEEEVWIPVRK